MLREVYMGDETREILRNETADYERARGTHSSVPTLDPNDSISLRKSTIPSSSMSRSPLSPVGRSLDRRGFKTASPKSSLSPLSGHFGSLEHSRYRSQERYPHEPLTQLSAHAHVPIHSSESKLAPPMDDPGSTHKPQGPSSKRRCFDADKNQLPELDLEIDVGLDIYLDESLHDSYTEEPELPALRSRDTKPNDHALNISLESEGEASPETLKSQIGALKALLMTKQADIVALQAKLNEREEQHVAEIQKIKQDMHREYSKQASEKLRVIIKRLELSAKKRAEKDWQDRVSKLNEVVENERNEKAELVRACDEYLRLKGF